MVNYLIIFQGSGKTYTIGSSNTAELLDDEYGVIPRALEQIFHLIQVDKLFALSCVDQTKIRLGTGIGYPPSRPPKYEFKLWKYEFKLSKYELKLSKYELKSSKYELKSSKYEFKLSKYEFKLSKYDSNLNVFAVVVLYSPSCVVCEINSLHQVILLCTPTFSIIFVPGLLFTTPCPDTDTFFQMA